MTRRFYSEASCVEAAGGYGVRLDQLRLRTPGGAVFVTPARALAEAVAAEWSAQGQQIRPADMPLSQLAFASIDVAPNRRMEIEATLLKYIEADLVCHRADGPAALVARQAESWDPIVTWAENRFDIALSVVTGVIAANTPIEPKAILQREIEALDDFRLTALAQVVSLSGSLFIGFALLEGRVEAPAAFEAAALDNLWSLERWGEDAEARSRVERLRRDISDAGRFIATLQSPL